MLSEKINEDLKTAMKQGEKERLNALRNLKARFIENKTATKVLPEQDVLVSYYKKLKDSLSSFPEGHALRLSTEKELKFLDPYMPAQMAETEVRDIIKTIIGKLEKPNMGAVMKELTPQIKGLFDGKRANELVKEMLT